jgi:uncharacterized membrane protein YphA (DoxX/SURF4 family)
MKLHRLLTTTTPAAVVLIRLMVGSVFLTEGVQKFLFAASLGVGRFAKIGFPHPEVLAPLVGSLEIVCGLLVIAGLATRIAALPLAVIILTALVTTKFPILVGTGIGPFAAPATGASGFWAFFHEARTDWSMLLGSIYLILEGGGRLSLDHSITKHDGEVPR